MHDDTLYSRRPGHIADRSASRVAIVGAGVAGLTAARTLADHGLAVSVFEKGRGPGGRTARRRQDGHEFDHGAQYFTSYESAFVRATEAWLRDGVIAEWRGRVVRITADGVRAAEPKRRFVGADGMSGIARHLSADLDARYGHRVSALTRSDDCWRLSLDNGDDAGLFDSVIVSAPAPQTAELLSAVCPAMAAGASVARYAPCWTIMLAFDDRLDVDFDGAFVETPSPLRWIARNASKPGRPPQETWIANGAPGWSAAHLEDPAERVADTLVESLFDALGGARVSPRVTIAHRWRYALVERALDAPCLYDEALRVAACGDWCIGPRVEAAFLSGAAAAARVVGRSGPVEPVKTDRT